MSDYKNPYTEQGGIKSDLYSDPYGERGQRPSAATAQLFPYVQEEKAKKKLEWQAVGLLPIVFDILQTGNYMSAGMANEIWKSVKTGTPFSDTTKNVIKAAWDGLTWKDKKTYSDVIRGNLGEEDLKKFDEKVKVAGFTMPFSPVDIAGFIGDVLLDPVTYVGFGATKAAKASAMNAAEDAVKIAVRGFDEEALQKLTKTALSKDTLVKAFEKGGRPEVQKLLGASGDQFDKFINKVYQDAYRSALVTPAEKLKNTFLGQIGDIEAKAGKEVLPELKSKLLSDAAAYAGTGQRSFRFFGFEPEALKSVRKPWAPERAWETLKKKFGEISVGGHSFSDAWWSVMNTGPMGTVRKALNIRNPYDRMIRNKELDAIADAQANFSDIGSHILRAFDNVSDNDAKMVDKIYQIAETYNKQYGMKKPIDRLAVELIDKIEKETGKKLVDNPNAVAHAVLGIEQFNTRNMAVLKQLEAEGLINSAPSELMYYIRSYYMDPTTRYGFSGGVMPPIAQHRVFTRAEVLKQDIDRVKVLYGVDDDTARTIVQELGGSAFSSDIKESMLTRALIQSKIEAKANLIRMMKEFGVPVENLGIGKAAENTLLAQLKEKGLDKITTSVPAFEGMLFDKSIKSAVERVVNAVQDESMGALRNLMSNYNAWWKGTALLGPHTKIRNFVDNNWTGFVKHGAKWFDVKQYDVPAVIATMYAARASDPKKVLKQFGLTEGFMQTQLNKIWFTTKDKAYTLRDLADIARHKGVFSARTMGYDIAESAAKMAGKEEKSLLKKVVFVGHETSHKIDEIVENTARIKSFLMDIQDVAKELPAGSNIQTAIDYASLEAKKWWIDYCFDEKTEILTDEGWKNINTIRGNELALTYNAEKEILEYTTIDHVHKADYEGLMYSVRNKRFDAFVTPHHKWVKVGGFHGGSVIKPKWSIVDTDYIASKDTKIIVSACAEKHKIKIYSDQFVTLCGWILAEGTYPKNVTNRKDRMKRGKGMVVINHILLYQSLKHNPQYVEEIRELMRYFKIEGDVFSEGKGIKSNGVKQWYIGGELSKKIRGLFPKKVLTHSFINELTTEQCELLMNTLNKGDGSKNKHGHWEFVQKNKDFIDAYQHLCFMCGHRTIVRKRSGDSCYSVSVIYKEKKMYVGNADIKKRNYSGRIWCITTNNHTLVARRNGTIYITGNSDLSEFERKVLRNVIPFYCVPEYSLILTKSGWKNIDSLNIGDIALTYNIDKNEYEWQPVEEKAIFDCNEPIMELANNTNSIMFTHNHRWVVRRQKNKITHSYGTYAYPEKTEILEGKKLRSGYSIINVSEYKDNSSSSLTPKQAKLLGWLLTDGYFRWRGEYCEAIIYQHSSKYLSEVIEVAGGKPRKPHPDTGCIAVPVLKERVKEIQHLLKRSKVADNWIDVVTSLSRDSMDAMYDAMYKADGVTSKNRKQDAFATQLEGVAITFEVLSTLLGYRVKRNRAGYYVSKRRVLKIQKNMISEKMYVGRVWCPKTKNGTWVMKQNGFITITGNTFIRHNVANKLQSIIMYPETMSVFPKFQDLMQENDPNYNPELIPAYMKNLGMFPVGKIKENSYAMLNTGLSIADFNKIPLMFDKGSIVPNYSSDELKDDIISSAHPILKTVVEMIPEKGYDTFRKRDLAATAKAPYLMRYLSNSGTSLAFLDGLMRVFGFEDGLRATVGDDGKLEIDAKIARIMESNLPIIRHLDMILMSGISGLDKLMPGLEQAIEKGLGVTSDYEGLEKTFQIIAYWTGFKLKEADLDAMKKQYARDIYYSAQERRIQDMKLTAAHKRRKLKYDRREDARMRRLGLL